MPCPVLGTSLSLSVVILAAVSEIAAIAGSGYRNQSFVRAMRDKVAEVVTNGAGVQTQPDLNSRTLDFFLFLILIFD